MEWIGWVLCLIAAGVFTFAGGVAAIIGSGFAGKFEWGSLFFIGVGALLWYLAFTNAPFSIVLN